MNNVRKTPTTEMRDNAKKGLPSRREAILLKGECIIKGRKSQKVVEINEGKKEKNSIAKRGKIKKRKELNKRIENKKL